MTRFAAIRSFVISPCHFSSFSASRIAFSHHSQARARHSSKMLTARTRQSPPLPVPGGLWHGSHVQTAWAMHAMHVARGPIRAMRVHGTKCEHCQGRISRCPRSRRSGAVMAPGDAKSRRARRSRAYVTPTLISPSRFLAARLSGQPFTHCGVAFRNSDGPASSAAVSRS